MIELKKLLPLTLALCFLSGSTIARGQVVFHYQAFQGGGKDLPNVPDSGPGANDGTADDSTKFSSSVPEVGVPTARVIVRSMAKVRAA